MRPRTNDGQRLLAHELTHVVQQTDATQPTIQMQPAFPSGGIKVTGPDANELVEILSFCTGYQLVLDKDMLKDSGRPIPSSAISASAAKELNNLIKDPNGIIIDTDRNVPGAFGGKFRQDRPGFHNVNVQHTKVLASASGVGGGVDACSAIAHEISEAAKGRELGVQGKTPQADLFQLSHERGLDIENKIRADFKLPPRNRSGSMLAKIFNVNNSHLLSLFSNTFGSGSDLRTQLSVVKTHIVLTAGKPTAGKNEILASHVVMGTVKLDTVDEGREAFARFFPSLLP
jgi:Domain of unknown function (DUF4157)